MNEYIFWETPFRCSVWGSGRDFDQSVHVRVVILNHVFIAAHVFITVVSAYFVHQK